MFPRADPARVAGEHFDLVVVGSGFGSAFFLHRFLERRPTARALVVEWGDDHPHDWQIANGRNSAVPFASTFRNESGHPWEYTVALGGGMNCWFAQTPRFHPSDFRLRTLYGVGQDWPLDYDALEPFYAEAEAVMSVAGDPDMGRVMPRSRPFPQPPHRLSSVDRAMKAARPDIHFAMPTARARLPEAGRGVCCASLRCRLCPVDAKFTAHNGFRGLFSHPAVTLVLRSEARRFEPSVPGSVGALVFAHAGREHRVRGDLFVLGASAVQAPAILHRSGMADALTGVGLHESHGTYVEAMLDGLECFDGGTITTGLNFGLYDGPFRSDYAAALLYFENSWTHGLRPEPGRWRQVLPMMIVTEDLPSDASRVVVDGEGKALVQGAGRHSDYARRGQEEAFRKLPDLLAPLPVESIHFRRARPTEVHMQGTLRMGDDPATSVVDGGQVHHRWRNLVAVGTSVFPSCSCANPSLTAAALSLRAAERLAA